MQKGDDRTAAVVLEKTAQAYRFLGWDKQALGLLGRARLNLGEAEAAAAAFEKLFAISPESRDDGEVMTRYLRALFRKGDDEKLLPLLAEVIADGPRPAAAMAQMMRGKRRMAAGETRLALMDFMRTADLFRDEKEQQAEACAMTAECLEKLGEPGADEYRRRETK
jgi:tetratricopeptide (TPR) repeat protein